MKGWSLPLVEALHIGPWTCKHCYTLHPHGHSWKLRVNLVNVCILKP